MPTGRQDPCRTRNSHSEFVARDLLRPCAAANQLDAKLQIGDIIDGRCYMLQQGPDCIGIAGINRGTWCSWFITFASHFGDFAKGVRFNSDLGSVHRGSPSFFIPRAGLSPLRSSLRWLLVGAWSNADRIHTFYVSYLRGPIKRQRASSLR